MKINTDIIRLYKSIHTWVGIISGMALFIAFYAGALTIFKEPLTEWASPPLSDVQTILSLKQASLMIPRIIKAEPETAKELRLNLYPAKHHTHQFILTVKDDEANDHDISSHRYFTVRAGADADNQLVTEQIHPPPVAQFIDTLHRVIGLPIDNDANRWIMGVFSTLYALALISGLIILLPILAKEFLAFRLGRKPRRVWLDAHNVVGVSSLPFHIIMAITAFVFAYHDLIYGAQNYVVHDGKLREALFSGAPGPQPDQSTDPAQMLSVQTLLDRIQRLSLDFKPYQLEYVGVTTPHASVRIWGHDAKAIAPRAIGGFIAINPYTGEIQSTDYLPNQQNAGMLTLSSFFALHFATYGGDFVRWVYFLLGLAGAWLFYTGNLLWVESRRKRQKPDGTILTQRKDVQVMAALTVGVCLGSVCGISIMLASSKWLSLYVNNQLGWHQTIYYAMFFSAIIWAFFRGAARALVDLLWLAAIFTFAVPLTSALSMLIPSTGLWWHLDTVSLTVDITALTMGAGFMLMARATSQRVYHNEAIDSIWAYRKLTL